MKEKIIKTAGFISLLSVVTIMIVFIALGGFKRDYNYYDSVFGGDGNATEAVFKGIQEQGIMGLYFNERVGAPEISSFIDASGIDLLSGIIVSMLGSLLGGNTAKVYFIFLYVTFLMTAFGMSYLLYQLKIKGVVNFVFSIMFTMSPYHFYRFMVHISLGNAFSLPLIILFSLYIIGLIEQPKKMEYRVWMLISFIIGIGNAYFVFFGLILYLMAFIYGALNTSSIKNILKRLTIIVPMMLGFILSMLPSVFYHARSGANRLAFYRDASEAEEYGLKIVQLLLPVNYSKIPFLRNLTENYYNMLGDNYSENYMSSLGIIGSMGFIAVTCIFVFIFAKRRNEKLHELLDNDLVKFSCFATLGSVLVGTVGGFGVIFNMLVTPQIRCYNRLSIVITCLVFVLMAYFVNELMLKRKNVANILLLFIFVLGLYDQVFIYDEGYIYQNAVYNQVYSEYFSRVEASVAPGASIYQLPFAEYPENGDVYNMIEGKHFVGYLFSDNLRWSYGAIKGRNRYAQYLNIDEGMSLYFLAAIKEAGYSCVYIDTDGYEDGGSAVLNFYYSLGIEPIVSADQKLYTFDLSGIEVEISDEECDVSSATFVNEWTSRFYGLDNRAISVSTGQKLLTTDYSAIEYLYSYIDSSEVVLDGSDKEYVDFLFTNLLGRVPSDDESEHWCNYLSEGNARIGLFYNIVLSSEFMNRIQ